MINQNCRHHSKSHYTDVRYVQPDCHLSAINKRLWPWRSTAAASRHSRTDASDSNDRNCEGTARQASHRTGTVQPRRTWSLRHQHRPPCRSQTTDEIVPLAKKHLSTSNTRQVSPVTIHYRRRRVKVWNNPYYGSTPKIARKLTTFLPAR